MMELRVWLDLVWSNLSIFASYSATPFEKLIFLLHFSVFPLQSSCQQSKFYLYCYIFIYYILIFAFIFIGFLSYNMYTFLTYIIF